MKKISSLLLAACLAITGFTQTTNNSMSDYYQLVMQGLNELNDSNFLMQPSFALQVKRIQTEDNKELEYAEKGNPLGTPVIFLHGMADSWHSFEQIISLLPDQYHAIALSQRGHGNSDKTFGNYGIHNFTHDVATVVTRLKLKQVVVVGHSLGGLIAQQFAIDYPHLVKALVMIDSDAFFGDNQGVPEFLQEVMALHDPIDQSFMDAFQKTTLTKPIEDSFYHTLLSESMKVPANVFKAVLHEAVGTDLSLSLTKIRQPVLLLWGEKDSFCLLKDQQAMCSRLKNAKLIIYPNTGHALHWEAPQQCVQDMIQFLNTVKP